MATIRAARYELDVKAMKADPIIQKMEREITTVPTAELFGFEFMMASNQEYKARGGKLGGHLGCVAEALRGLRADWLDRGIEHLETRIGNDPEWPADKAKLLAEVSKLRAS